MTGACRTPTLEEVAQAASLTVEMVQRNLGAQAMHVAYMSDPRPGRFMRNSNAGLVMLLLN